ncbi:MAG TPA: class I SAM-dependent methyltransferase [Prolixibacteraceae bacterium]|nr:class I SAM-dependent methyltransferase [Prolixibacteraceae bacterium]
MLRAIAHQLERPSGFFGKIISKGMDRRNRKFYQKMIAELDIQKGDKVYEIGYGPGLGISLIAQSHPGCLISGIDFSDLMVRMATKRNQEFIDKGMVTLKYGDLLTTETGQERYDKIFCVNVIYFWKELNPVFTKISSMLNNGGTFCIFMTSAKELNDYKFPENFNKYSAEEVERELKKAGFQNVEYKLDKGYYITSRK